MKGILRFLVFIILIGSLVFVSAVFIGIEKDNNEMENMVSGFLDGHVIETRSFRENMNRMNNSVDSVIGKINKKLNEMNR